MLCIKRFLNLKKNINDEYKYNQNRNNLKIQKNINNKNQIFNNKIAFISLRAYKDRYEKYKDILKTIKRIRF